MTKNNLLHYIQNETNKNHVRENHFKKHFNDFYSDMILYKYPEEFTFPQKLYHYLNDDMNFTIGKCKICGNECTGIYCSQKCSHIGQQKINITKEELEKLIHTHSFVGIGKIFGVSDTAIRKWCKKYNLPYRKQDIR